MAMNLGSKGVKSDLNVTPMIDILLVLLIIFMVITPLMMMQQRLEIPNKSEVDLPPDLNQDQVVLTYTQDRGLYLNRTAVSRADLSRRLFDIYKNRREKMIFLNIDPQANYGESMAIIAEVRASGLEKLAVITMKPGEQFRVPDVEPMSAAGL
ncbi:MAG: biopolymer transporter ExbD [Myxococcota bacterium]|nr:biopolymer transporter ExbD [Myxococcota bacterium]